MKKASIELHIAMIACGIGLILSGCAGQEATSIPGDSNASVQSPTGASSPSDPKKAPGTSVNPPIAKSDGWVTLFDGGDPSKSFRGFRSKSFPAGWIVRDGCLVRVGPGGDLITREQFQNFELTLDWKILKGGNSGIMYHVSEDANNTYDTGPEMQILDDDAHNDGKDRLTCAGANYALYPAPKGIVKPVGQWNSIRILCNGNHVEQYMNGAQICSFDAGSADWKARMLASKFSKFPLYATQTTGHIALQDHGDEVAFRNIRIKPLP